MRSTRSDVDARLSRSLPPTHVSSYRQCFILVGGDKKYVRASQGHGGNGASYVTEGHSQDQSCDTRGVPELWAFQGTGKSDIGYHTFTSSILPSPGVVVEDQAAETTMFIKLCGCAHCGRINEDAILGLGL